MKIKLFEDFNRELTREEKRFEEDLSDVYRKTFDDTNWQFLSFRSVGGKVEKLGLRSILNPNIMVDIEVDNIKINMEHLKYNIYAPKPKYAGSYINDIDSVLEILKLIEIYISNIEKFHDYYLIFDKNKIDEYRLLYRSLKVYNNISDLEKFNDDCDEFYKKYDYLINADDMGLL